MAGIPPLWNDNINNEDLVSEPLLTIGALTRVLPVVLDPYPQSVFLERVIRCPDKRFDAAEGGFHDYDLVGCSNGDKFRTRRIITETGFLFGLSMPDETWKARLNPHPRPFPLMPNRCMLNTIVNHSANSTRRLLGHIYGLDIKRLIYAQSGEKLGQQCELTICIEVSSGYIAVYYQNIC